MTITLKKGNSQKKTQAILLGIQRKLQEKKQKEKKKIIEETFGTIVFDLNKTALEIQKEMRDEWN